MKKFVKFEDDVDKKEDNEEILEIDQYFQKDFFKQTEAKKQQLQEKYNV